MQRRTSFCAFFTADAAVEPDMFCVACYTSERGDVAAQEGVAFFRSHFPDPVEIAKASDVQIEVVGIVHGGVLRNR